MRPTLYIGNRNYSSWSMRPWLVLTWGGIEFDTEVLPLGGDGYGVRAMPSVLAVSPTGTVPALRWGEETIADSLAISEWAAEKAISIREQIGLQCTRSWITVFQVSAIF